MKQNKLIYNLKYALIAQSVASGFSILMYLLVPKVMFTDSYGYWQLFLLYTNYSGFFHLGLVDGIYLKLGGMDYAHLNKKLIGSQFKLMTGIHILFGLFIFQFVMNANITIERKFVILSFSIYMVLYCIQNYIGFVFQAVNETSIYSKAVIIEKSISLIGTIILILNKQCDFRYYIILSVISIGINSMFLIIKSWAILRTGLCKLREVLIEAKDNISVGSILMFSGIASTFLIGSGRMIVDHTWGIETFGKLSFAISMINMLLLFIRQVSVVLFPALRKMEDEDKRIIYIKIMKSLSVTLPLVYFAFVPIKLILAVWLPQYTDSIRYLTLLLPICLYDSKMQMVFSTYLKVMRKEKKLLFINVASLIIGICLCFIAVIIFKSIIFVAIATVIGIAIRSIFSELLLNKILNVKEWNTRNELIFELVFSVSFMFLTWYYDEWIMLSILVVFYAMYLSIYQEKKQILVESIKIVKSLIHRENKLSREKDSELKV